MNDVDVARTPGSHVEAGGGADPTLLDQLSSESQQEAAAEQQALPPTNGMGWQNPRAIELDAKLAESAAATGVGSGFQFDPAQIDSQVAQCAQLIRDLEGDLSLAQAGETAIQPPAPDSASMAQAAAIRNMFNQAVVATQASIAYVSAWQDKLSQAKSSYMATDQMTATEWRRVAGGPLS
jgi:hypothetical protein